MRANMRKIGILLTCRNENFLFEAGVNGRAGLSEPRILSCSNCGAGAAEIDKFTNRQALLRHGLLLC